MTLEYVSSGRISERGQRSGASHSAANDRSGEFPAQVAIQYIIYAAQPENVNKGPILQTRY